MKTKNIVKEGLIWLIIAIPFIYFLSVQSTLPAQIPIHFNIHGQPDNWADKTSFVWLLAGMTLGVYALFLIIPLIDPKGKIKQMGNKYYILKLLLVSLMSGLSIIMIISAKYQQIMTSKLVILLIGLMFVVLGNYMPSVKPNYFIGVRTPWTLEDETNWRKTHRFTGWLWTLGGLVIILLSLVAKSAALFLSSVSIAVIIAFLPVFYSFALFLKQRRKTVK